MENNNIKKAQSKETRKILLIIVAFVLVVALLCYILAVVLYRSLAPRQKIHSYDEMTKYIDKLEYFGSNDKKYSYKLKGNYEIIDKEEYEDEEGAAAKKMELKVKGTDLTFFVYSNYVCDGKGLDDACGGKEYIITTDFEEKSKSYNSKKACESFENIKELTMYNGCEESSQLVVKNKEDLETVANYLDYFIKYLNDLDYVAFEEYDIYVYFDDGNKSDKLEMYLNVNDGKYSIHCLGDNECKDGTIKSYLQSFIDRQGIVIE